jgi:hypothetical protein
MDDCRDFGTSPFGSSGLPTFQISEYRFPRTDQTVHIYITEPDQWSYLILTSILNCLIRRPGLNQALRWMATNYFGTSGYYAYAILPLYFDQRLRVHPTSDRRSRSPSGLRTSEISNLNPFFPPYVNLLELSIH